MGADDCCSTRVLVPVLIVQLDLTTKDLGARGVRSNLLIIKSDKRSIVAITTGHYALITVVAMPRSCIPAAGISPRPVGGVRLSVSFSRI